MDWLRISQHHQPVLQNKKSKKKTDSADEANEESILNENQSGNFDELENRVGDDTTNYYDEGEGADDDDEIKMFQVHQYQ